MKCLIGCVLATLLVLSTTATWGQVVSRETATVQTATQVLDEVMSTPGKSIPRAMLADAEGVAIIPNVIKVGFVAGVRFGRGVVMVRDQNGNWTAPSFITITGGSVGWQAGAQATDVVLCFKTRKSIEGLLRGKFTLGADAAVAAGPVGRRAEAATDAALKAEIYSYSRSRGLFAGVALDGAVVQVDQNANAVFYGVAQPGQQATVPPVATQLVQQLIQLTSNPTVEPLVVEPRVVPGQPIPVRPAVSDSGRQLASAAARLYPLLDENWRQYLALPGSVYEPNLAVDKAALELAVSHFDAVAADARFAVLAARPEFRNVHELLKQYAAAQLPPEPSTLALPPPPAR